MSTKSHELIFHIFHYAREKKEVNYRFNLSHFSHFSLLNKTDLMHLPCLTSVWRQWIKEESGGRSRAAAAEEEEACGCGRVAAVAEEMCARGRAMVVAEEAGSSGVDDGGGDRQSREHATGT
jgi:hypothetical protein